MEKGVFDILTVIDPKLVPWQGIRWVKRTIRCFENISEKLGSIGTISMPGMSMASTMILLPGQITLSNGPSTIRTISQDFVAKLTDVAQGRRKRGNKRNAKKNRSEQIDLPVPVHFTEADAVTDSESEKEMVGSDTSGW
ncbi:hypothetical protein PHMEG_00041294 [Phytophthora megakarya]|uniref:Uncharacterized protein n=1 Tax=Phytophthora megakarya TaxID=4795 RepID=A0A225UEK0_9STRA|nr:hypothetical protein PHMEG_00041294 [Phytophthora megakarya]